MKKRLNFISLLFLLLLFSCCKKDGTQQIEEKNNSAHVVLDEIDSLMWRQPDSALAVLMDYLSDDGRDAARHVSTNEMFDNHYTQLLASELLYKNDYEQTNRKDLLQAVDYFDSLCGCTDVARNVSTDPTIAFLDARAHYINGVGYYERDSVVEACKEYLKALEVMEEYFEDRELVGKKMQFAAFIYTRLTDLFSDLYLHEQAIFFAQSSLAYYNRANNPPWFTARMLNEIGSQYDMMDQTDSAALYYQRALEVLGDTDSLLYRDITTHLIYLEYKEGSCPADISVKRLRQLLLSSESDRECQARYQNIGEIYYHEHSYDSAWVYLNTIFHTTSIVGLKKQAAEWLVEICKVQNRETEILEYADFLVPFANLNENQSSIKSQMTTLYHEYEQKRTDTRHQQKMTKNQKTANKAIGLLLGIITIVVVLYLVSKKRHYKVKKQNDETEHQLKIERQAHKMKQAALAGRLKKSYEEVRELKDQIKWQDDAAAKNKTAASFTEEPICCLIMERVQEGQFKSKMDYTVYKDSALDKQQLLDLRLAADRHFSQFTTRIKKSYPELTNSDLDYCCLYLLGLTDADIAALMQRAYNTIVERDNKLKRILGNDNPLAITLMGIAKS